MDIQKILTKLRITELNEMQQHAAEAILGSDGDVVLLSPTGTGKTLAYLLPLVQSLTPNPSPNGEGSSYKSVDFGNSGNAERGTDGFCSFLACGDDGTKMWQLLEQGGDVGWLHHLKDFVGGIVL